MVTKIPQTAPAIGNQLARPRRIDQENRPHRHLFQQPARYWHGLPDATADRLRRWP
jgi:hypothetical protein